MVVTDKTKDNLLLCVVTRNGPERILVQLGPLLSMSLWWGSTGGYFVIFAHFWPGEKSQE